MMKNHLLIAGCTGSGKSTLIQLYLYRFTGGSDPPDLYLIDPKKIELYGWACSATCRQYADTPAGAVSVLSALNRLIDARYEYMRGRGLKDYDGSAAYCIIDEWADLIYSDYRHEIEPLTCRLLALGRAARVFLIIATQRPTREILPGMITANITDRIALHCATAQESRNIIGVKGAELLPRYGYGLYYSPDGIEKVKINPVSADVLNIRLQELREKRKIYHA